MKKKTLKTAPSIIITKWLDELHDLPRKRERRKSTSTIRNCATTEELREADEQTTYAARGIS